MRSRSISTQQGQNEDEEDISFLDEVVTKVKDTFRRAKHRGSNMEEVNRLKAQLGTKQAAIAELRQLQAHNEENLKKSEERDGCLQIQLEQLQVT